MEELKKLMAEQNRLLKIQNEILLQGLANILAETAINNALQKKILTHSESEISELVAERHEAANTFFRSLFE